MSTMSAMSTMSTNMSKIYTTTIARCLQLTYSYDIEHEMITQNEATSNYTKVCVPSKQSTWR